MSLRRAGLASAKEEPDTDGQEPQLNDRGAEEGHGARIRTEQLDGGGQHGECCDESEHAEPNGQRPRPQGCDGEQADGQCGEDAHAEHLADGSTVGVERVEDHADRHTLGLAGCRGVGLGEFGGWNQPPNDADGSGQC